MTSKERIYAILNSKPFDRPAVTPIFMAWAANYIGKNYSQVNTEAQQGAIKIVG